MPGAERQPIGLHLAWLLAVAIAGAFVTALIVATRDLATYWPLYVFPVVLASLAYHAPGAIVSVALSSAIVALLVYETDYDVPPMSTLAIGAIAFAVSGVVIGIQTQRYRYQRDQLEQDATRDTLTGACRADYFEARLDEEVRRSARYGDTFTLSLVRVLAFDEFLRLYGRVKGDLLLERLARVLGLTVRNTDIVGRIESATFAMIMPATTAENARGIADRVVSAVEATEFEGDALEPVVHRSVEVVSVAHPDDATDPRTLMSTARERLGPPAQRPDGEQVEVSSSGVPSLEDVRT